MRTESTVMPSTRLEIEAFPLKEGSNCTVVLYDNIEGPFKKQAAEEEQYYTYDRYCIETTYRRNLKENIEANFEVWLKKAKDAEEFALAKEIREKRNQLLAETDWTQTIDAPISAASRETIREYRQNLRNITEQEGFPNTVAWPICPKIEKADPDPVDVAFDDLVGEGE